MRLHRMISIMLLIENKGKVKAKDLAEELETSVRTIYRDIDALCEAGIPLAAETGPNGGIHFIDGYKVGINDVNKDDIIKLYLSSMGVNADKESDMAYKVKSSLLKLQKNVSDELSNDINTAGRKFFVDDVPWWGEKRKLKYIDEIVEAVWQSKKLKIKYEKVNSNDFGDYLEVTVNMFTYEIAKDDIMTIIGYGEVLQPVELRKYIKEELKRLINKY